jgi:hypothetical protein
MEVPAGDVHVTVERNAYGQQIDSFIEPQLSWTMKGNEMLESFNVPSRSTEGKVRTPCMSSFWKSCALPKTLSLVLLVGLAAVSQGCTLFISQAKIPPINDRWIMPAVSSPTQIVMVSIGLNNRLDAFHPLANAIAETGAAVLLVPLSEESPLSSENAVASWRASYRFATERFPESKISVVAYSLSAASLLTFLNNDQPKFEKFILLAPATHVVKRMKLIRALLPLRFLGLALPSLAPAEIRAASWLALSDYNGAKEIVEQLREVPPDNLLFAENCFLIGNDDDEMVDLKMIRALPMFSRAKQLLIPDSWYRTGVYKHLFFHPSGLTTDGWKQLTTQINDFLSR